MFMVKFIDSYSAVIPKGPQLNINCHSTCMPIKINNIKYFHNHFKGNSIEECCNQIFKLSGQKPKIMFKKATPTNVHSHFAPLLESNFL